MAYNISAFAGAGAQFFDNNGDPLVGGLLYVYTAGTVTPATTWTSNSGAVANTNPIVLDAAGRTPNQIWLNSGVTYKFILKTSTGVTIGTYDNIPAIDDPTVFNNLITVTGTNTLIGTSVPPYTTYVAGMTISFVAVNTNTGAVTIDVDGLGAKNIFVGSASPLSGGEIVAGRIIQLEYDGTRFQLQALSLADGSVTTAKFAPSATAPNATNLTGSGTISSTTTGTTQSANDNSTKIATTAYADRAVALRSYISGLTLSTAGGSTTMSIAVGQASDASNVLLLNLAAPINKTTGAWVVGTGSGGLDTGTIANGTWYYFFIIRRPDTGVVDVIFSTNSSAPTLPTNYTQYRYIGAGLTNGSGQWTKFTQFGDTFYWDTPVLDFTGVGSATAALLTCSVPRGRKMLAFFNLGGANNQSIYLSDPSNADLAPSITTNPLAQWSLGGASTSNASAQCMTNTSAQIRHREQGAVNAYIATLGWVDLRGKDL